VIYFGLLLVVLADNALGVLLPDTFLLQTAPPDLALLTALYIGIRSNSTRHLGYAVTLGLIADCFSSHGLGHFAFLFGAAAWLAHGIRRYLPPDAPISHIVACFICGVVVALLGFALAVVTTGGALGSAFGYALLGSLTTALCAPVLFSFWDHSRLFRTAISGKRYDFA
jgi:rod shape-determining protein MreD